MRLSGQSIYSILASNAKADKGTKGSRWTQPSNSKIRTLSSEAIANRNSISPMVCWTIKDYLQRLRRCFRAAQRVTRLPRVPLCRPLYQNPLTTTTIILH